MPQSFRVLKDAYLKTLRDLEEMEARKISIAKDLGAAIGKERMKKRMSFDAVGKRLNLSRMYVYDMEHGRRFPSMSLIDLFSE